MTNNENAIMERNGFLLPTVMEGDFSQEDFGDDFDGLQLSFQRVKIPSGGTLQFEVPGDDPEDPDYEKFIEGVIIYNHASNAYWPSGSEYDETVNPICSSVDGKVGFGDPGCACAMCDFNKFGSDPNGKGKLCKNMRTLYILRSGEAMPIQLSLPPTSIRPFTEFVNSVFVSRHRPSWSAVVQIGLKKVDNGTNVYSVATFRKTGDFAGEELAAIKQYAATFREQIKLMQQQRAVSNENRLEADVVYDNDPEYTSAENGSHFAISHAQVVNGSNDELPL